MISSFQRFNIAYFLLLESGVYFNMAKKPVNEPGLIRANAGDLTAIKGFI